MQSKLSARWARLGIPVADGAVGLGVLLLMVLSVATKQPLPGQRAGDVLGYVLTVPLSLPYLVHRRYPMTAAAVTLAAFLAFASLGYAPYPGFGVFAMLYGVARHADRRRSAFVLAASLLCMGVGLGSQPDNVVTASDVTSSLLAVAVSWLIGENQRNRRARWAAMEERAARLESEREARDRQAVADERLRIARELHDVVAHSMSVIAIQSGVGRHLLDSCPEESRKALEVVETTSRSALTEMRRLLGVLREEVGDPAVRTPASGLGDLGALVTRVRDTGLAVSVTVEGDLEGLAAGLDLSAYRLVQEALTNVIKHGGPVARVVVRRTATDLEIEVTDDGRLTGNGGRSAAPAATSGHGLIGMRERVALFDGELTTGPRPGGGFRVVARMPLGSSVAVEAPVARP